MKNLYSAFLCLLGLLAALTQGLAKDLSGGPDSAYITSIDQDHPQSSPPNDHFANATNVSVSAEFLVPPANDDFANATNVTALINAGCTSGGSYTTIGATGDQAKGSCWNNGPNNNVWFKFTATSTGFINFQVNVNGPGETMSSPFIAIFDAGLSEIACQNKSGGSTDGCLGTSGLTPGNTYYIAVDKLPGSNAGTFDICLSDVAPVTITYNGSPYCATGTATVTRTGPAGGTYRSTGGLSINAATGAIDLAASTAGTYTVSYALSVGNCDYTATTSVTILVFPIATISYAGTPFCTSLAGTQTVTRTGTAGGTYSSTAGLTINAATGAITPSTSTAGTYAVTYTMVAGTGCAAQTATTSVTITALPVATFSYTGSPYCQNAANPNPTFSGGGVAGTFSSTVGLVFVSTATGQINLAASTAGTYTVTNTIAASGGCALVTATSSITITTLPAATISYAGSPFCTSLVGAQAVTQTGTVGGTYSSTAGLTINAATGAITPSTSTAGTYTVTYTLAAAGGCAARTATTSVTITALPVATFSYAGSPYCKNSANPNPTFGGGGIAGTFSSTAGLVFVSTATGQINLAASTTGTYTVTNTIAASGGCAAVTATSSITITTLPVATIVYIGTPFCTSLAGAQAVTQTGTAGGTYSSTAGLTINSATGAITPGTSTAGIYTVAYTLVAAGGCAAQTATTSVTITALPVATFSYAGSPYCQNAANPSPTFSGGGVAGTFSSTAGLVFVSTATGQINLAASIPGTYTITNTIAAAAGCAVVTATSSITITALPVATFSYTGSPYCQNAANPSPTFSGGGVAGTFLSTAGLVFVSTATGQINLAASTAGTYTITNTIAASGGCAAVTATSSITITTLPAATISYAGTPFCTSLVGAQVVTQTGAAGGTYSSTAGLTINASTGAIIPSTSTAGTYTVTYTMAAAGGCAAQTATTSVTITTLPAATISYAGSPFCTSLVGAQAVTQTGTAGGTYSSTAGLTINAATGAITPSTSTAGTYTVIYTMAAAGGCAAQTATTSVTITALPVATFIYGGTPYCQNAANPSPTFSGGGVAGSFSSTAGLVFVSTATGQINLAASIPGTYTVTNTIAASGGCAVVAATSSITITTLPAATIGYAVTPFCTSLVGAQSVTQTGTAGGTYSSTAGLTINAATGAITPSTSTAGTYTVTYTMAAAGGCAAQTATTSVTITALPVATFSYAGSPYCQNAANPSPTFSGGGAAGTFSSTAGLVFVSTATGQINLAASTPGTYTVTNTIAAAGGCAVVTAISSVTITALPVATFSYGGTPYCQDAVNPSPTFSGGGVAGTFSSTAGLVFVSTATGQINLAASTAGTYTVTNTIAVSGGCAAVTATSSITITTLPAATINYAGTPFCSSLVGAQSVTQTGTAGGIYSSTAGLTINAATGAIIPSTSTPGSYTVTYAMAAVGGCAAQTATTSVTITALPVATFSYAGSPYCQNATNPSPTFSGSGAAGTFSSTAGLVFVSTATGQINLAASTPGTYTVTNTIAASGGCAAQTATTSVTVTALPVATFSYAGSPYCQNAANPNPTFSGGGVAGTFSSTAGLVFVSTATGQINLAASTPGTYTVTNTIAASGGCAVVTATSSVTITTLPAATISYAGSPFCTSLVGAQAVTQTGTAGGTYSSTAGLTINAATGAIIPSTSTVGTYTVTYTMAAAGGCAAQTATTSVTITALPVASFSYAGSPYCQNAANPSPTFSGGGVAGIFLSTAGLVFVSTATGQINLAASTAGTYTVTNTIAASGGCAAVTATSSITITTLPAATISYAGTPFCTSLVGAQSVTQTGIAGGTYSSTAGLTINAATGAIIPSTSTPGSYTVTYTMAAAGGCAAQTATTSVTITALPAATINYVGTPFCISLAGAQAITQTGTAGGTYSSTAGLTINAATGAITPSTSTAGTYTVTYTMAAAGGCAAQTATTSVTITTLPAATISYAGTPFCTSLVGAHAVTQTGTAGGTYSSTAGLTINAATGAITPSTSTVGTYTVTYTMAAAGGCAAQTATTSVTITALPVASFSYAGSPYCQNAANPSPTFSGGGVAGTFSSTAGLVIVSTATGQINLAASIPGTYTITNTIAASGGCAVVATTSSVTITALPVATFSYGGTPYCQDAANPSPTFSGGGVAGTFSSTAGLVFVSTATGQINLAASTPGTYTVTNTIAASGGCAVVTATSSVTITTLPAATISYAGSPFCTSLVGAQSVTQTGTAGGTYSSTAGLTINAATGAITPSTSTAGTYTVTYTMAAAGGCAAQTATTSVTITTLPAATISYAGTPFCTSLVGAQSVTQTGTAGGTYFSTAGLSINAATGAITSSTSTVGTYTVTYTMAAAGGCAAQIATTSVIITALPVATFIYGGTPYCQNAANPSPTFSGGGAAGTFSSTAGLVFVSTATGQINLDASTPGTYTVTNTIAASGGCAVVTATSSVTITTLPAATISYAGSPFCTSLVGAQAVTQTGTAGGTYSSTAGLTINAATGAITPSTSTVGTYTVTYTMAAAGGCAAQTATTSVTITALPVATIVYIGSPYCITGTATVTQTGQAGGTYTAPAGVVINAVTGDIDLAASTPGGPYTITYTFTNGTCSNTTTAFVTITPVPTVVITNPAAVCAPATVDLTAAAVTAGSTAGLTYTYFMDAAGTIALGTPNAVAASGTYYIKGTTAGGCVSTLMPVVLTVTPVPTVVIINPAAVCAPATVDLTGAAVTSGSTAGLTFTYFTDAVGSIALGSPNAVSVSGTYYIKGTTVGGCVSALMPVVVTINTLPSAIIVYAGSPYCATGTAVVTQTGQAGGTYIAPVGVTINASTGDIDLLASTPGTYTITYSFTNGTCSNTTTTSITINALPIATINYLGGPYCGVSGTVNITQTGQGGGNYTSTVGLSLSSSTGDIDLGASTAGTYTVTYSFTNGTCSNIATTSVTINAVPPATISYTGSPYCNSGTAAVTQTGQNGGSYTSTPGLSLNAVTGAVDLTTSTPGAYIVTYTFGNGICINSTTNSIAINPKPTVVITNPAAVCVPGTVDLTAAGVTAGSTAGLTYTYFSDAAGTIVLANASAVAASGTYYIVGTTASGCSDIQPVIVTINAKPTVVITNPAAVCAPGTVDLTAAAVTAGSTAGLTYTYYNDAAGTIALATPNAVSASGTYYILGTTASGCSDIQPVVVTINPAPTVVITNPAAVCAPATVDLTAAAVTAGSTAGLTYTYFSDAAGLIVLANPNVVAMSGTYYIVGTTASGCSDIQPVVVTINVKPTVVITNPAAVCAPATVDLTAAAVTAGSTAGLTYTYFNDAAGTIALGTPSAISTSGTYYIVGTTASGCSDIQPVIVTINAKPTVVITNPAAVCAPGTVDLTAAAVTAGSTAGLTYTYYNDAAGTIALATPNAVSASGTYYIMGTTASGCSDIQPVIVTINAKPTVVIINPAAVCAPGTVDLTASGVTAGSTAGLTYTYYTDAAGTIILANANAVAASGTYYIMGTTASGCSDIQPVIVTINAKPAVVITNPAAVCAPGTVDLTAAAVTAGSTAGLTYTYYTDAAGTIALATPNAVNASGTYYIVGTTASGCSDIQPVVVTINPAPTVVITNPAAVCAPGTVDLTAVGVTAGSTAGLTYTYYTDAAGTIALATPNAVSASGTYYIMGTTASGCSDIQPVIVTINAKPTVVITNPAAVCAPATVDLTAAGVTAGSTAGLTYTYYTDAAGTIILANANAVAASGTYYIMGTTASGCSDIQPVVITINPAPTVVITNPAAICAPGTVDLTAAGVTAGSTAGLTYTYFSDAAGTIVLANASAVAASGTYYIVGTTASGCSDIQPVVVTINAKPTVVITNPAAVCAPGTVDLTAAGITAGSTAGLTYTYFSDAAGTIVLANANAVATSGTYYIMGTTASGCSDIQPVVITINAKPAVVITNPAAVCAPATVDLTAAAVTSGSTAGLAYTYFSDAAGTIVLANANAVATSGTYYIMGTTASGCSDIQPVIVTINSEPTVVITNPAAVCAPGTVDLTAAGITAGSTAGLTYTYFSDAAASIVLANPNAVAIGGTYYVKGTNGTGCTDVKPVTVTINPLPVATITYTGSPYCTNGTAIVSLTGTGGGTFTSAPGLGLNAATGDINLAASTEGTYIVVYSFTNGICSNSVFTSITIRNPLLIVNDPPATCAPATIDLTDPAVTAGSQGGLTFSYYQDNAGTIPLVNPTSIGIGGTYYIKGTDLITGCSSNIQPVVATINTKPSVSASSSATDICKGTTVTLTAVSPGNSIDWAGVGTGNAVTVAPTDSTTYLAIATAPNGCADTASVDVAVKPFVLTLTANPDPVLAGTNTTLATSANFTYNVLSWSPAIFFTDQTALTQNIVVKDTSKSFTVIAQSSDGCLDTATLWVTVNPNLGDFFIPNSFSPNGDGNNDIFKLYGSSVRDIAMRVYNQWGELIFETTNAQNGWDGTWKGRPQAVGVYVYVAKVTFYNNTSIMRKGTINLIR